MTSAASADAQRGGEPVTGGKPLSHWVGQLKATTAKDRADAARRVGDLREQATTAAPDLLKVAGDTDKTVRAAVALALGQVSSREGGAAVPALTKLLADGDKEVRVAAALGLGMIGDKAKGAAPALTAALTDSEPMVRQRAAYTLGLLGAEATAYRCHY